MAEYNSARLLIHQDGRARATGLRAHRDSNLGVRKMERYEQRTKRQIMEGEEEEGTEAKVQRREERRRWSCDGQSRGGTDRGGEGAALGH